MSILISWFSYREHYRGPFRILGPIESGLIRAHAPSLPRQIDTLKDLVTEIPAAVLIMAVSWSFLVHSG
ncbi:hypothetical protein ACHAPE_002006 [Trichoderma viride]